MISVQVVADSVNEANDERITTIELCYPRIIHAEFMTHRMFSRNASSSRAIPMRVTIKDVLFNPFIPWQIGLNQSGMYARGGISRWKYTLARWLYALPRFASIVSAACLYALGIHKQVGNRLLEPWQYIKVLVTSTEWENFFSQRCTLLAEPHMCELAFAIREALAHSTPTTLKVGEWHLPYHTAVDENQPISEQVKFCVARCARVSYAKHGVLSLQHQNDLSLYNRLCQGKHMSPFEHVARAMRARKRFDNFTGWMSYRRQSFAVRSKKG